MTTVREKRQRRVKNNSEFETPPPVKKLKSKDVPSTSVQEQNHDADMFQPGDVVWSKLGSFPWWPALIFPCKAEGGSHSRTLNSNQRTQRQYFVYFYGKYLEYAWISTRSLIKYAGLDSFIQQAENAVQKASTKSEQLQLANRYQLKVSVKKRPQWDEAIALADRVLLLTREQRMEEFNNLLKGNSTSSAVSRRHKTSVDKNENETISVKKSSDRLTSVSSEIEYDYVPLGQPTSLSSSIHIPPLSNYEQKQIVEALIHHEQGETLTLDQAQTFATSKATEIVEQNYHYRMAHVSPEWFYDSILLKYPSVVFKYRSWFEQIPTSPIPSENDPIALKQWLIALMIEASDRSTKSI